MSKFQEFLKEQIDNCPKSQVQIAKEVGYANPNNVTMIKKGTSKLAIEKIPRMARTLGCDPSYMLRLAMAERMPDVWEAIEEVMGADFSLTENERAIIKAVREMTDDNDPELRFADQHDALRAFAKTLVKREG